MVNITVKTNHKDIESVLNVAGRILAKHIIEYPESKMASFCAASFEGTTEKTKSGHYIVRINIARSLRLPTKVKG